MTTPLEALALVQQKQIENLKTTIERQNKEIEKQIEFEEDNFMFKQCSNCNLYVSESGRRYCDFCGDIVCEHCPTRYKCSICDIDWCGKCVNNLCNYETHKCSGSDKNMSDVCKGCKNTIGIE